MEIKPIGKDHIGDIVNLEAAAFNGQGEDIYTLMMIAKTGWILGAFTEVAKLAGAVEIVPSMKPGQAFIHGLIVEPQFQYNGVGAEILKHTEDRAKEFGFQEIACTIAPWNGASLNTFINKAGYEATGFEFDCYGEGEHRLWVKKTLGSNKPSFPEVAMGNLLSSGLPEGYGALFEDDFSGLDSMLNSQEWTIQGIVRPKYSGLPKNSLIVTKISK